MAELVYFWVEQRNGGIVDIRFFASPIERDEALTNETRTLVNGAISRTRLKTLVKTVNDKNLTKTYLAADLGEIERALLTSSWSRFRQEYKTS